MVRGDEPMALCSLVLPSWAAVMHSAYAASNAWISLGEKTILRLMGVAAKANDRVALEAGYLRILKHICLRAADCGT